MESGVERESNVILVIVANQMEKGLEITRNVLLAVPMQIALLDNNVLKTNAAPVEAAQLGEEMETQTE